MKKKISPNKYKKLLNKGINYQNSGQLTDAMTVYKKILKQQPHDSHVHYLLGSLYGQTGDLTRCINELNLSVKINNKQVNAYHNLAIAYEATNQIENAIKSEKQALCLSPNAAHIHCNLSDLYRKQKHFKEASHHLAQSLAIAPNNENALINKAILLTDENKHNEASQVYQQAVTLFPHNPVLLNNYSAFLQINEQFTEAEAVIKQVISLNPNYAQAHSNLANLFIKRRNYADAEKHLLIALTLLPSYVEAHINLGFVCHNTANFNDALKHYNTAISLTPEKSPQNITAHWYRTFTLLITGKFDKAWADYEYRFNMKDHINDPYDYGMATEDTLFTLPTLISAEQGIGDQIMFATCLPDLLNKNQAIVIECDERLKPIFSRAFPNTTIIHTGKYNNESIKQAFPEIKQKLPIGSLPHYFRNDIKHFPQSSSHLFTYEEECKNKWEKRYQILGNKLRVGISWEGGTIVDHKNRSMSLNSWTDILKNDCHFINLQHGDHRDEIKAFKNSHGITIYDWNDSDSLKNLDDFSAQISALDLVISVGNTNVHLAGSLNVPTWCLIPHVPSWRWMFDGETCLWYSSVKIFRQAQINDWQSVLNTVKEQLYIKTTINDR